MTLKQLTTGSGPKLGALLLGAALLAGCSATESKFVRDGLNATNEKEANQVMEPNAMAPGPGLFTGKSGSYEVMSHGSTEDSTDPNKPRRVERRRR